MKKKKTQNKVAIIVPNGNPANITGLKDLAVPGVKILMGTNVIMSREGQAILEKYRFIPVK